MSSPNPNSQESLFSPEVMKEKFSPPVVPPVEVETKKKVEATLDRDLFEAATRDAENRERQREREREQERIVIPERIPQRKATVLQQTPRQEIRMPSFNNRSGRYGYAGVTARQKITGGILGGVALGGASFWASTLFAAKSTASSVTLFGIDTGAKVVSASAATAGTMSAIFLYGSIPLALLGIYLGVKYIPRVWNKIKSAFQRKRNKL